MPTDLAQLLITVTATGFDEVLDRLAELERTLNRVGRNSGIDQISRQLQDVVYHLEGMHDGINDLVDLQSRTNGAMQNMGNHVQDTGNRLNNFGLTVGKVTKAVGLLWGTFAVARQFVATNERIAQFNMGLTNMALNAGVAREEMTRLAYAAEGMGGSKQGAASLETRLRQTAYGVGVGRGLGMFENVMSLYGLDISGSNPNGTATPKEQLVHIAELFDRLGDNMDAKLDVKDQMGMDDGIFKMLLQGADELRKQFKTDAEEQKKYADAVKASEEILRRKAEVDKQWNYAELEAVRALSPLTNAFEDARLKVAKYVQEHDWAAKTLGAAKPIWDTLKQAAPYAAAIWGVRRVAGATSAVANVAGAASGAAGAAGAGMRGAAALSRMSLLGAIPTVAFGSLHGIQNADMMRSLAMIDTRVEQWHQEWLAFTIKANDTGGTLLRKGGFQDYLKRAGVNASVADALYVAAANAREMNGYVKEVNRDEYKRREAEYAKGYKRGDGAGASKTVNISSITITVSSDSADAAAVAREVREELFRQINAAIDDAQTGVNAI